MIALATSSCHVAAIRVVSASMLSRGRFGFAESRVPLFTLPAWAMKIEIGRVGAGALSLMCDDVICKTIGRSVPAARDAAGLLPERANKNPRARRNCLSDGSRMDTLVYYPWESIRVAPRAFPVCASLVCLLVKVRPRFLQFRIPRRNCWSPNREFRRTRGTRARTRARAVFGERSR